MATSSSLPSRMRAVVLKEALRVVVEDRPVPRIQDAKDVVVKVHQSGLCGKSASLYLKETKVARELKVSGSDLHWYRGHQPPPYDFILGHEVVGEVIEVGGEVRKFQEGDVVVSAFSTSCGDCYFCQQQYSSRCVASQGFGTPVLEGCQAEYVRIPLADTTLFHAPPDIPKELLLLMTDILPTGYQVAFHAKSMLSSDQLDRAQADLERRGGGVCVVIGCGPVGLCAITAACTMFDTVLATDIAAHRLDDAKRHGAIALPLDELKTELERLTDGRGADACLEVVGHPSALVSAVELCRPYGVVSSCGLHTHEIVLPGPMLYAKNIRLQFGRCAVMKYFNPALELLRQNQDLFGKFIQHEIGFDQAEEYYTLFERNAVGKTVFDLESEQIMRAKG